MNNEWKRIAGWFCAKKTQNWERNLSLTKNQFGGNEICCVGDNHNHMNKVSAKEFLDSSFN